MERAAADTADAVASPREVYPHGRGRAMFQVLWVEMRALKALLVEREALRVHLADVEAALVVRLERVREMES